jgi:hypothetical protein
MIAVMAWPPAVQATVTHATSSFAVERSGTLQQGTILAKHRDQWITWHPFGAHARSKRLRIADPEAYSRVPLRFPVELEVAPDGKTARVVGVLE